MIYIDRNTGEKVKITKDAVGDYVLPCGKKTSKHNVQKNYRFSRKDSKPIRRLINIKSYKRVVHD